MSNKRVPITIDIDLSPAKTNTAREIPARKYDFEKDDPRLYHPVTNPNDLEADDLQKAINIFRRPIRNRTVNKRVRSNAPTQVAKNFQACEPIDLSPVRSSRRTKTQKPTSKLIDYAPIDLSPVKSRSANINVGNEAKSSLPSNVASFFRKPLASVVQKIERTLEKINAMSNRAIPAMFVVSASLVSPALTAEFQDQANAYTPGNANSILYSGGRDTPEYDKIPPKLDDVMLDNPNLPQAGVQAPGTYRTETSSGAIQRPMTTFANPADENGRPKSDNHIEPNITQPNGISNHDIALNEKYFVETSNQEPCQLLRQHFSFVKRNADLVSKNSKACRVGQATAGMMSSSAVFQEAASEFEAVFMNAQGDVETVYTNKNPYMNITVSWLFELDFSSGENAKNSLPAPSLENRDLG